MPRHLTKEERDRIAQMHHQGYGQEAIALAVGRSQGTVSRELRRNRTSDGYFAAQAQEQAEERRRERPVELKMERDETSEYVRRRLASYWSPEQIEGRLKVDFPDQPERWISAQTIYAWIAEQGDYRAYWEGYLRRRGKRPKRKTPGSSDRAKIADRPAVIEERERVGDFEGDTILGPPGTGGVVTFVDRNSRYTIITKIQRKHAPYVRARIYNRLKELPPEQRQSATFDNGTEFAEADRLGNQLEMEVYYAEPGCPYQRGTNENTNGLIRQFFPKGSDFRDISHQAVRRVEDLLNGRPRACLGYRTPNEVFHGKPN
jgi:IS30 family transposase